MRLYIYLLVLFQIEIGLAIRCYSCVGKTGSKKYADDPCLNPAKNLGDGNVKEIECLNTKLCWKAITAGQLKRGCGEKRCAFIPDINMGSVISQTCCSNDLCNRTSVISASQWVVSSLFIACFTLRLTF
ncbi:unnamed protein product [Adineta ricciae]|uniref:Uncharacterized protein n=1 Tax=Adineta ricciae TaxID=249248 RepID=A0A814EWP2_ADIRI|nr:unnamed protein product [Adineta ricciae]CAF1013186.1 unnamed protein product [Adineta ricciae]